jgi:hypothetical protein
MYWRKVNFSILVLSFFVLSAALAVSAQDQKPAEGSYDVVLQIVMGGDDKAANQPLPQNLSNIAKQLKANYPFSDYKLANTYVGRIGLNGNIEYKSISNVFGQSQQGENAHVLGMVYRRAPRPAAWGTAKRTASKWIQVRCESTGQDRIGERLDRQAFSR